MNFIPLASEETAVALRHGGRKLCNVLGRLSSLGIPFLLACSSWLGDSIALYEAEEQTQQGDYQEAIVSYQKHIAERNAASDRPEWENPYFYLLRIGDLQLRQEKPHEALESYQDAERQKVEASLISDRYRAVANWYIERGNLQEAFEILSKYRDRDSLLFDAMLDRVGRELTAKEKDVKKPYFERK